MSEQRPATIDDWLRSGSVTSGGGNTRQMGVGFDSTERRFYTCLHCFEGGSWTALGQTITEAQERSFQLLLSSKWPDSPPGLTGQEWAERCMREANDVADASLTYTFLRSPLYTCQRCQDSGWVPSITGDGIVKRCPACIRECGQ